MYQGPLIAQLPVRVILRIFRPLKLISNLLPQDFHLILPRIMRQAMPLHFPSPFLLQSALWLLWLCGFSLLPANAQTQQSQHHFYTETYSMRQGLHHGTIYDFQPDTNGFVWFNTVGSIQLFDGLNFVDFNHLLKGDLTGTFNESLFGEIYFISRNYVTRINTGNYADTSVFFLRLPQSYARSPNRFLYENEDDLFILHDEDCVYQVEKKTLTLKDDFSLPTAPHYLIDISEISKAGLLDNKIEYYGHDSTICTLEIGRAHV